MAKRSVPSSGSKLESDSCPEYVQGREMERRSGGGVGRPSTGRQAVGTTETDGCLRPAQQMWPSTEYSRHLKPLSDAFTGGSPRDDFRSQRTPTGYSMEKPSSELTTTFGWGTSANQLPIDRRSLPEQRTLLGGGACVGEMAVERQSPPQQRTFDSGTSVGEMPFERQLQLQQRPLFGDTILYPVAAARQPLSDTRTPGSRTSYLEQMVAVDSIFLPKQPPFSFIGATPVGQAACHSRPLPERRIFGHGRSVDQVRFECRSSPEQRGRSVDQMEIDRDPAPTEQKPFCSWPPFLDPARAVRESIPKQGTFGSGTTLDQMKCIRSYPEQGTPSSMFPSQLGDENVIEDRGGQSDEESGQIPTTAMENCSIEGDDVLLPAEARPLADAAIFAQDEDGDTTLHLAIVSENLNVALCLIHLAPDPLWLDRTNDLRQTALHLATIRRQPLVIRRLLSRGAKRIVHDRRGNTPLHIACLNGHLDCVRELTTSGLEEGAAEAMTSDDLGLKEPNYEGQTCLHLAASRNQLDVIRYLVEDCGINVNQKELRRGCTILHRAVMTPNLELLDYLLNLPASAELILDEATYDDYTALHLACLDRKTHIEQKLRLAGAQQDFFDNGQLPRRCSAT